MKKLLLSTAILAASTLGAAAQDLFRGEADAMELRASDLIGMRVYASEAGLDATEIDGLQDDWEDVGEVNDIVLSRDGAAEAVLVDIGGFLGMGERQVAVSMGSLQFVSDSATADEASDFFLVMNASRADLEGAPDYAATGAATTGAVEGEAADVTVVDASDAATETEMAVDETAAVATDGAMATDDAMATDEAMASDDAMATDGAMAAEEVAADEVTTDEMSTEDMATTEMATDGMEPGAMAEDATDFAREGYVAATGEDLSADRLQGAVVYDSADERVGEVSELLMTAEGQVTEVVVDVGGFLGIGEKPVALGMDELDILRQDGGDEVRVYLPQTREELDAMESYAAE